MERRAGEGVQLGGEWYSAGEITDGGDQSREGKGSRLWTGTLTPSIAQQGS